MSPQWFRPTMSIRPTPVFQLARQIVPLPIEVDFVETVPIVVTVDSLKLIYRPV